jgi:hypothetical protein
MILTIEETLLDAKKAKVSEFLGVGMAISHATIDQAKVDEREVDAMRKELESLRHQAYYYKDTTQAMMILRAYFLEEYGRYKLVRDAFMEKVISYQEETLLCIVAHKEMLKWDERAHRTLNQIEYIREIQKGRGEEEHGIKILTMTAWPGYRWPQILGSSCC